MTELLDWATFTCLAGFKLATDWSILVNVELTGLLDWATFTVLAGFYAGLISVLATACFGLAFLIGGGVLLIFSAGCSSPV